MKKLQTLKIVGLLAFLVLSLIMTSCSREDSFLYPENDSPELQLKGASMNFEEDNATCDLTAGQNIQAGVVNYSHDATNLYVEYLTFGEWVLTELHLYVGPLAGMPTNKNAVQIGKFPYSATNLVGVTSYTFTIPLADLKKDANGYAIAAHAVVENGEQNETAWADCNYKPYITVKCTFDDETYKWAASDGDFMFADKGWIGPWLGINLYEIDDQYMLQSWKYPASNGGAGTVSVTDDGSNLLITVTPDPTKEPLIDLNSPWRTYIYVGTLKGLIKLGQYTGGCPDYKAFPYQKNEAGTEHKFTIPVDFKISVPFSGSRWGWYSYYNF